MRQLKKPTRVVGNTKSCIDLVVTINPESMISFGMREKIASSCDHKPTFATLNYSVNKPKSFECMFQNYKEGHNDAFRHSILNTLWNGC